MSKYKIPKNEIDILSVAIERIVASEIPEKDLSGTLPLVSDLQDSNKVYTGKASILFVDMRDSSHLPEKYNKDQLIKIYRSYVRTVVQAIRYSGGVVRDFMGDGVLAVFLDGEKETAEETAVYAARYISTVIDKILNPKLNKVIKHRISCGIGVYTGEVSLSKVGMRGKEQDEEAENEYGIAWIGNCTNMACKFSGAVSAEDIFISTTTYVALTEKDKEKHWKRTQLVEYSGSRVHAVRR